MISYRTADYDDFMREQGSIVKFSYDTALNRLYYQPDGSNIAHQALNVVFYDLQSWLEDDNGEVYLYALDPEGSMEVLAKMLSEEYEIIKGTAHGADTYTIYYS